MNSRKPKLISSEGAHAFEIVHFFLELSEIFFHNSLLMYKNIKLLIYWLNREKIIKFCKRFKFPKNENYSVTWTNLSSRFWIVHISGFS